MLDAVSRFEVLFQKIYEIVSSCPCFGIGFPAGVTVVDRLGDEGNTTVSLNELHIDPSTDVDNLRKFLLHVLHVVLLSERIDTAQVEVALVDDFVVRRTIQESVLSVRLTVVVDDVGDGVATIG